MYDLLKTLAAWTVLVSANEPRELEVGDWYAKGNVAMTTNSSGSSLLVNCDTEQRCGVLLFTENDCEVGRHAPMLVNSMVGAITVDTECMKGRGAARADKSIIAVNDHLKEVFSVIVEGRVIGFTFPLKSGFFYVFRFSLNGSQQAIAFARKGQALGNSLPSGSRDSEYK